MIRRYVFLFALAAVIDIVAGAFAWHHHLGSIEELLDTQADSARTFLASAPANVDRMKVLSEVSRPDIDVVLHDRASDNVLFSRGGVTESMAVPMPPPLPGFAPPPRHNRFSMLGAELAHIHPRHVEAGDILLTLAPAPEALMRWLLTDIAICISVLAALIVAALITGTLLARAAREPLVRTTLALEGLAGGNFEPQKIEAGQSPDIARLARAYNAAAETVADSIEERRAAAAEFQRFLADAGHELRTPLTIVGGYIDVLAARAGSDVTGDRVFTGMKSQMSRMRAMVEKMLLLSRLESGTAAPRVVDVASVAGDAADTMRDKYPGREVTLHCDPAAAIFIDEDDLYEAQCNLLDNALSYAPGSAVVLSATTAGDQVEIEVADRGPGIAPEEQSMIFERFYRGKDRADSEGSGLGLAIVRRIVERWGGTVGLDSDSNGTRVTMRFPRAEKSP